MKLELLINVAPFETRVALVADATVSELHLARAGGGSLTGNIYVGRVVRVVPGMQAAFVEIGLERPGFLHASDVVTARAPAAVDGQANSTNGTRERLDIRQLVHEGEEVLVQVAKDPISSKGARLTTDLAIASRHTVLMPFGDHIGISQRIEDEDERERLRNLIAQANEERAQPVGFIARTAAEGTNEATLHADMRFLSRLWDRLLDRRGQVGCPGCLYEELPLHIRVVRDLVSMDVERICIDEHETFTRVQSFVEQFLPEFVDRLELHEAPRPLFQQYGVEDEIERALQPEIALKSGGSIVIEQTEAMVTIDVNTGGYVGTHDLEETVYRTNLEAAAAIPRQLRLRNLGGIVVIDFIDMLDEEHRRHVLRTLEKACEGDPARIRIDGFSMLGLVQMSRKRTRESLRQQVCVPCVECAGSGFVKSAESTALEVLRAVMVHARRKRSTSGDRTEYLIRADSTVVDRLLDEDADQLERLCKEVNRSVRLQVEPCYGAGQFDVVLVQPLDSG